MLLPLPHPTFPYPRLAHWKLSDLPQLQGKHAPEVERRRIRHLAVYPALPKGFSLVAYRDIGAKGTSCFLSYWTRWTQLPKAQSQLCGPGERLDTRYVEHVLRFCR